MTLSTKHKFQSAKADGTDNTLVKPSNWNDDHNLQTDVATGGVVLGRPEGAGPGPITDLPMSAVIPAGVMLPFAGVTTPAGWLLCDGRSVLRSDYPNLFAAIGSTYGAVDGLHFSVPDMRGRVPAGVDAGTGRLGAWAALGGAGGSPTAAARVYGYIDVNTSVVVNVPAVGIGGNIAGSTSGSQFFDTDNTGAEFTYGENNGVSGLQFGGGGYAAAGHAHQFRAYGWTQGQALSVSGYISSGNTAGATAYGSGTQTTSIRDDGNNTTTVSTVQSTMAFNYIIRT